jgi:glycosyltransferase involved in cell wall biosynthesis
MTTISVIIPACNAQDTILETIESVRKQTFTDLEIIVINDGSKDRTLELLTAIEDRRLKVFSYTNAGLPTARNRGIVRASGKYISFLDADDLWTPDKLEKQLATLQTHPKASVVYSWIAVMLEAKDNCGQVSFFSGKRIWFAGDIYRQLLVDNFIGNGSNILAKIEAIRSVGEFDPSFKSCEDWEYYLRLAAKYHFAVVPEHQILYRKTPINMTSKGEIMEREGLKVIEQVFQSVPPKDRHLKNQSIANFYRYCGKIYVDYSIQAEGIQTGKKKLFQAIAFYPLILLSRDTYILFSKILLKQLLPDNVVKNLTFFLKKPFAMKRFERAKFAKNQSIKIS